MEHQKKALSTKEVRRDASDSKILFEPLALNFTNWIMTPSELTIATFVGYSGDQEYIRKYLSKLGQVVWPGCLQSGTDVLGEVRYELSLVIKNL